MKWDVFVRSSTSHTKGEEGEKGKQQFFVYAYGKGGREEEGDRCLLLCVTQNVNPLRGFRSLGVTIHHKKPERNGATKILAVNNWIQLFDTNGNSLSKKIK